MNTQEHTHLANHEALRRRLLRALSDLGLGSVLPAAMFTVEEAGISLGSLTMRQVTLLTNALEDAANRVGQQVSAVGIVHDHAQPERLPVAFTAARISPLVVQS
jgi:hypothetical protein